MAFQNKVDKTWIRCRRSAWLPMSPSGHLRYCNEKSPCSPNSIFPTVHHCNRDVCKPADTVAVCVCVCVCVCTLCCSVCSFSFRSGGLTLCDGVCLIRSERLIRCGWSLSFSFKVRDTNWEAGEEEDHHHHHHHEKLLNKSISVKINNDL